MTLFIGFYFIIQLSGVVALQIWKHNEAPDSDEIARRDRK